MKRIDFNDNWCREILLSFANNVAEKTVSGSFRLPEDAMISSPRSPESVNGPDCAWHTAETYTYLKQFEVPEDWRGRKIVLEFEGIFQNAFVFINDQFAGKYPNGYIGFKVPVHTLLDYGKTNYIKVTAKAGMQKTSRWYTGGGIYRPVWMLQGSTVHVHEDGIRVETLSIESEFASLRVRVPVCSLSSARERRVVQVHIKDKQGKLVGADCQPITLFGSETIIVTTRIDVPNARLWSIETPELYTAEVKILQGEIVEDEAAAQFGVRTLAVSRTNGLCINGKPIKLRGACIHHDNGPIGAISLKDAELRRIRKLKAAGFNAVRSAHNPASNYLLEACDEVGMLVMDELFDVWNESKRDHDYSLYFEEYWRNDIKQIVSKDFNHPCVVFYTIGNEIPETGTPWGASRNRAMTEVLRSEDPTRPVVNCLNGLFSIMPHIREIMAEIDQNSDQGPGDINTLMTTFDSRLDDVMCHQMVTDAIEETFAGVDVCGYNYMQARYVPDGARYPNRIIVGSETNPDKIGYNWPLICSLNYVLGDFCWTGWDYIGEAGVGKNDYNQTGQLYGPWPWYLAWCGDHDICGERRPQSYYRQIVYGLRSDPYLCVECPGHYGKPKNVSGWTWPDVLECWTWPGFEGKPIRIEVYSNGDQVKLLCNGKSVGTAMVGEEMPNKAVFHTRYQPGILTAISYHTGAETGRVSLHTVDQAEQICLRTEYEDIAAQPDHLIYIELILADQNGERTWSDDRLITIGVNGPAKLAGFASGDPQNLAPFDRNCRMTYNGMALVVLRTIGQVGEICVTATASGLKQGKILIQAK